MMTSEALTRLRRGLGYLEDGERDQELLDELNDTQQTLQRGIPSPLGDSNTFLPWFLMTEYAAANTTPGEERVLLPTDYVGEYENCKPYIFDSTLDPEDQWKELQKDDIDFLKRNVPDDTTSTASPSFYSYSGNYIRFRPAPQAVFVVKWIYGASDTILTASPDITNKWLTHCPHLLISATGISMAAKMRDASAQKTFSERFGTERNILYSDTLRRTTTNDRPVMGGQV